MNTFLRVLGIVLFVVGAQGIIRGIILGLHDNQFKFEFILSFIPNQFALIANIVLLLISFVIFARTKPFDNEKNK